MQVRTTALFVTGFAAMLAAGWAGLPAVLYTKTAQPLDFNHRVHTAKDKGAMACQDCHAIRADGSFAGIPRTESCAACHAEPVGATENEKRFVAEYVKPNREVPWLVYSRQPVNARFSHAIHVTRGKLACETCHGDHGSTEKLRVYQQNRISGYSRDIWGGNLARIGLKPGEGMKMTDCESCHHSRGVEAGCLGCHQ
jgi:hypothetical protein